MCTSLQYRFPVQETRSTAFGLGLSVGLIISASGLASAQLATFELLNAPGGLKTHGAFGVSSDGSVVGVFHEVPMGENEDRIYRWTSSSGMQLISNEVTSPETMMLSHNGNYITSQRAVSGELGIYFRAFRWSAAGGIVNLGPHDSSMVEDESELDTEGHSVSDSGVVVGYGTNFPGINSQITTRWTGAAGSELTSLSVLQDKSLLAISASGGVIAGGDQVVISGLSSTLPSPVGATSIHVTRVSANGKLLIGGAFVGQPERDAVIWSKNDVGAWTVQTTTPGYPTGVSNDGRIVGSSAFSPDGWLWTDDAAFDIRIYMESESGEDLSAYLNITPTAISADGSTIVGFLINSRGEAKSWRFQGECTVDTDEDGLLDCWETDGIRYFDENDELQLYVLDGPDADSDSDADPEHKDLFVEVDEDLNVSISPIDLQRVITAFDQAPVSNPDGVDGITLHVFCDDLNLPLPTVWATTNGWPTDYETIREDWFGTQDERDLRDDGSEILDAKAKAFRYSIIADTLDDGSFGTAEDIPSDDFFICLGESFFNDGVNDSDDVASTWMHELGHCLGLGHGGGDDILGKPNYPSIMNYMYADRLEFNKDFWTLDYSDAGSDVFQSLDESDLNENIGISSGGEYDSWIAPFGVTRPDGSREVQFVQLNGTPTDFGEPIVFDGNTDGEFDTGIVQDLNFIGNSLPIAAGGAPSPDETLEPHDDWDNIHYPVVDGSTNPAPRRGGELTSEAIDWLNANVVAGAPCPGDANADGMINFADITDVLGNWLNDYTPNSGLGDANDDGLVDFSDITEVLGNWLGACP